MIQRRILAGVLVVALIVGAAHGESPAKGELRKLCLRAYVKSVLNENWNSGAARSRANCQAAIDRRAGLADEIKAILKKYEGQDSPDLAEARKIYASADAAAHEYTLVLKSNVIPEDGPIDREENWQKVRPMLLRAANHEIEIENIVMKWTYEIFGNTSFFEPRSPIRFDGR